MQNRALTIHLGQDRTVAVQEKHILVATLILGGILRFAALGRWSLWTDELYNLTLMPVSDLLAQGIPADQHPPLYYLLLEQILKLGQSEWLMRLPSALAGLLTIPLMYRIGTAVKQPKLAPNFGLLAAALLAFAPLHVWYSREARMYGLAMFFWVAAIYFYIQSWRRDNWLDTLGLVLMMTGGLYTAYPTLALWFIQLALAFLFWRLAGGKMSRLARWLLAQGAIAALFYVWQPFLQRQLERPLIFNWFNFFEPLLGSRTAEQLNQWLAQSGLTTTLAGTFQLAVAVGLLFVLLFFLLSLAIARKSAFINRIKGWERPIAILIMLVFVAIMVVGAIPRGLSLRRQLLVFWIPLIIPAAWAILRLKNKWLLGAVLALSLLLSAYAAFGPAYEDWRSVVVTIANQSQPGDQILVTPPWSTMAFDYYYDGSLPYAGVTPQQVGEAALNQSRRLWLVANRHPSLAAQTQAAESWFLQNGRLFQTYQYPQYLTIYELEFANK